MSTYWIRNRGRVQGPFTLDRIRGLLRRGRFSRHFHVSLDKKEWLPAEDFPELFGSKRRRGRDDDEDDDAPFRSGGSPFDDDDEDDEPSPRRRKSKPKKRAAILEDDDDEYEDEDDEDEDEWEDDEDWDEEEEGFLDRLVGMVEANLKLIGGLLVAVLGVLCWFLFFGESFAQDQTDMETLMNINTRITSADARGLAPNEWLSMQEEIEGEVTSLIKRLESTATSQDHIKQELLFIARDDLAARFKELPNGVDESTKRIMQRFGRIDEMIKSKTRQHAGSIMTLPAQRPPQPDLGNIPGRPGANNDQQSGPAEIPEQNPDGIQPDNIQSGPPVQGTNPQQPAPPNGTGTGNGGFLSNPDMNSLGNQQNGRQQGVPGQPNNAGSIPGQPPKAKFGSNQ